MAGGDPPRRSEAVECTKCKRFVSAIVKGSVWYPDYDWQVLLTECSRCGDAVLVGQSIDPPSDVGPTYRLWPEPARRMPAEAPQGVKRDFDEAERCFNRGDYTASATMTRRCLEGMAKEAGATGRDLARKLNSLRTKGVLNDMMFEWATELRYAGNKAVHETADHVERRDAEDALIFAKALAEHIFTLSKKFAEFRSRGASKRGGTGSSKKGPTPG